LDFICFLLQLLVQLMCIQGRMCVAGFAALVKEVAL
jgi:hypothetical protein